MVGRWTVNAATVVSWLLCWWIGRKSNLISWTHIKRTIRCLWDTFLSHSSHYGCSDVHAEGKLLQPRIGEKNAPVSRPKRAFDVTESVRHVDMQTNQTVPDSSCRSKPVSSHIKCDINLKSFSLSHERTHVKDVPGSMYLKKMALVTSPKQDRPRSSCTGVRSMNIHLPSFRLSCPADSCPWRAHKPVGMKPPWLQSVWWARHVNFNLNGL